MEMHRIITSLAPSSLLTSLCKGFYKDHQPDQDSGVSRQEAVQSSLGEYHCLSLTKDVPGHLLASLKRLGQAVCEVLISLTSVLKMIWSCPSFSKMALKSVERGRLQTGFMKRAKSRRDLEEYLGKCANLGTGRTDLVRTLYGPYGSVRTETSRKRRQKKEAGAKDRLEQAGQELCIDHVSSLIYGKVQGSLTATNQAPVSTLTRFK
ncbi:hypothetical protein IGI04_036652 [Brassica rapa subsp. trilocularis]|uniref:Nop domain-containing protein n=1 Tax=Brassica rapa subsp. trilocularis TaxID=1813537 RepID=A0ABQ7LG27_BRACM|nr:hypothetical protein IGI04_036652 [Brassica rapa subsp. trilocularis]